MLRILGSRKRFCDGVSRRDLLQIGGVSALGLGLSDALPQAHANSSSPDASPGFGRAKRCILIFPFGAQPQHETFDPKPLAPAEIQGEMRAIDTAIPGVQIAEGLPKLAAALDRATIIRSMTHPFPVHGVAYALTGMPAYTPAVEGLPRDASIWPYMGSISEYFLSKAKTAPAGQGSETTPFQVAVPWMLNSKAEDYPPLAGVYGSYLGQQYDPLWADFDGKALHSVPKCRHEQTKVYTDPYGGIDPSGRFTLAGAQKFPDDVTLTRFNLRQSLLGQVERGQQALDTIASVRNYSRDQQQAISLLTSRKIRDALDVTHEPEALRNRYGMTLFGQSCLAARRLIEAGTRFTTVFWDAFGTYFSGAWDTHQNHYPRLREYLLPGFDAGLSALLVDLDDRGLLDDTLVVCMSEHGRTPQIDSKPVGAARHHWSRVYSALVAGGGTPRGTVVGASDRTGGDVLHTPVSPKDIQATTYHLLGIDPEQTINDPVGRPLPIHAGGTVRGELIAGG
jgi:hypothetical protein